MGQEIVEMACLCSTASGASAGAAWRPGVGMIWRFIYSHVWQLMQEPGLGVSASIPTHGHSLWPRLPHNVMAGFQGQLSKDKGKPWPFCELASGVIYHHFCYSLAVSKSHLYSGERHQTPFKGRNFRICRYIFKTLHVEKVMVHSKQSWNDNCYSGLMERSTRVRDVGVLKFKYSVLPEDPPDDYIPHKGTNNKFLQKSKETDWWKGYWCH